MSSLKYLCDLRQLAPEGATSITDVQAALGLGQTENSSTTLFELTNEAGDGIFFLTCCGTLRVYDAEEDRHLEGSDITESILEAIKNGDDDRYSNDTTPWFEWTDPHGEFVFEPFFEVYLDAGVEIRTFVDQIKEEIPDVLKSPQVKIALIELERNSLLSSVDSNAVDRDADNDGGLGI